MTLSAALTATAQFSPVYQQPSRVNAWLYLPAVALFHQLAFSYNWFDLADRVGVHQQLVPRAGQQASFAMQAIGLLAPSVMLTSPFMHQVS